MKSSCVQLCVVVMPLLQFCGASTEGQPLDMFSSSCQTPPCIVPYGLDLHPEQRITPEDVRRKHFEAFVQRVLKDEDNQVMESVDKFVKRVQQATDAPPESFLQKARLRATAR